MKKIVCILLANIMLLFSIGCQTTSGTNTSSSSNNGHVCSFTIEKPEEKYLKAEATCLVAAEYYYVCECGDRKSVM